METSPNKTICLDKSYSTTRCLTRQKPEIINKPEDKFKTRLFMPPNPNRKAEGGLRTQGYFKKSTPEKPLITIITVVYNGEAHLEETILSVLNQTYDNVEYIIIDGASTDNSLQIIKKFENSIDYYISEKDFGISDAFNKGVICGLGKFFNFQGDGDGFYKIDTIESIINNNYCENFKLVSGRIARLDKNGEIIFFSKHIQEFSKKSLLFRMSLPHQGLFTHRKMFKNYGLFDVKNIFCMDYEHLLRAYHDFPVVLTLPYVVANWRADGIGNNKTLEIIREYNKVRKKNRVSKSYILAIIHFYSLIKLLLKKIIKICKK